MIDIDRAKLPTPEEVDQWTSDQYTSALRHDQKNPAYNPSFRQLLHVGFKEWRRRWATVITVELADEHEDVIAKNVTTDPWDRHIRRKLLGA